MKKITQILLVAVTLGGIVGLNSCKKQLNLKPKYGLNTETVYGDPNNYIHVVAKLYSGLSMTGLQGPAGNGDIAGIDEGFSAYVRVLFNLQELPTDEVVCGWNDPGIPEMNKMNWSPETSFVKGMYYRIFYQITLCNEFIRETSETKMDERGFTEAQKATIRVYQSEARFLRSLSYYHAMDLFGNVPFVTEEDEVGAFQPKRITRSELFSYVESELLAVEGSLLAPSAAPYGRANKVAAQFLLAKLYLNAEVYTGVSKNTACANYSLKVINSGAYSLDDNYQDIFLADNHTSPEIIFPVIYDGVYAQSWGGTTFLVNAAIGGNMIPADYGVNGAWGGLRATSAFVNKFPDSTLDGRFLFYRDGQSKEITNLSTFAEGYAFPKFKNKTTTGANGSGNALSAQTDIDFPMFRLADAYLMYAEAALRGGGDISQGLGYVNQLRQRAYGNSTFNFASITLDDIIDERARELSWECTRRTDLIRFNLFTTATYVWPFKGGDLNGVGVSSFYNLYPIPTADIVLNPNLIQNSGY
jgi:hypothetical protein